MNNKKIITAFAAVTIIASSAFAGAGHKEGKHSLRNPENVVALMVNNHDVNQDGRLNSTELAKSIESLYELRNDAISNRHDALVANGIISPVEAQNGFVTLSFLPEDGAAILMNRADANQDNVLEITELLDSREVWRELNLGTRPYFSRRS